MQTPCALCQGWVQRIAGLCEESFMTGYVTKDEYANTLRAYQSQQDEMKSDDRDKARTHMFNEGAMWV